MLGTPVTIETIADVLQQRQFGHVVLDPVLICKGQESGAALDTDQALRAQVLPLATFVTPNHFEALTLSAMERIESVEDLTEAARRIHETSGAAVLAKAGVRLAGPDAVDVFYDGSTTEVAQCAQGRRGGGGRCRLHARGGAGRSAGLGADPLDAARAARAFVIAGIHHRLVSSAPFDAVRQSPLPR